MCGHANLLVPSHSLRALLRLRLSGLNIRWKPLWQNGRPPASRGVRNIHSGPTVRRPCQKYPNGFQTVAIICLYLASAAYWPTNLNSPEPGSESLFTPDSPSLYT